MAQVIKKLLTRTLVFVPTFVLALVVSLFFALQIPALQTVIAQKASRWISEQLQFPVSIQYVHIHWLDRATFKGILIADRQHNRMIDVPELTVDFELSALLQRDINVDEAILSNARVQLIKRKGDGTLNMDEFIAAVNELKDSGDTTRSVHPPVFSIDRVGLQNVHFSFADLRKDTIRDGFDYNHVVLDSLNGDFSDFRLVADTIDIHVNQLTSVENRTNLDIKQLRGFFRYTRHSMRLTGMEARIGNSLIRDSLVFEYQRPADLSEFNTKVTMSAHLDSTSIDSRDLAQFAPVLNRYRERWTISGDFNGKVVRFRLKDVDFRFGQRSRVQGKVSFDGLPDVKETFIDLNLTPSVVDVRDLRQYITDEEAYQTVRKFGRVALNGEFLGFPKDFVANGNFNTDVGRIVSDVNLKIRDDQAKSTYSGTLALTKFNLGKITDQPERFGLLDMNGKVKGTGFAMEDALVDLNATVHRLGFNQYEYRNAKVDGRLGKGLFKGVLSVNDPNLVFNAQGKVDLRNNQEEVALTASLEKANLRALNLLETDVAVRSQINVDFRGLDIDDVVGKALFTESAVLYNNQELLIDSLYIFSATDSASRTLSFTSDFASADVWGDFTFARAYDDLRQLLREYQLNFRNDAAAESYYLQKNKAALARQRQLSRKNYRVDYQMDAKDLNPLFALFYPAVYLSRNTRLEGAFTSGVTSILSANTAADSVFYNNYKFYNAEIDISTSKLADSTNVLASAYVHSDRQQLGNVPKTEDLTIEAIWSDDRINFESRIQQTGSTNYAELNGNLGFFANRMELRFKPSHFQVLDNDWHIAVNNLITMRGREITFENVSLTNRYQMIAANGVISDSASKALELTVQDFNLQTLNPILGRDILGTANGFVALRDLYNGVNFQSDLAIDELVLDNFLIGNITGKTTWDPVNRRINVNYQIYRMNSPILRLTGMYDPNATENSLDMRALLNRTNLEIMEPFLNSQVSNLGGVASGTLRVGGTLASPLLSGSLMVKEGRFKYNYLNTTYHFEDQIYFGENEISVKRLQLLDENNNVAIMRGGVFHDGFKNFVLDLRASLQNFKVLNTDAKDNSLFYGTAITTGNVSILGASSNLTITASVRSDKGTRIFIPVGGSSKDVAQQEYIQFVSKKQALADTVSQAAAPRVNLSGVKLDFNFDVTPDAYCEIIFDIKSGDIIRGNGNGKIKMQVDPDGEFTMFGDYVISKGAYNFTLMNAINKEFEISPGSRISWSGDPYGGTLNINATYQQTASLLPILGDNTTLQGPEYSRRYPVDVQLNLTGDLLSPDIKLGIDFASYPQNVPLFRTAVAAYEARLATDEQELNRQVFSLMILRKLSPEGAFSGVSGSVGNSVSELLSNQLSYWASQVDENLEIDLSLNGLDQEAFNTLQLRLSYSLFDGRLRVTRDGSFTNSQNQSNAQSVIGDWTVEYMLTKDGKLRLKAYNRNTQNVLNVGLNNSTNTIAGFSLLHVQSFNTLKEFFESLRDLFRPLGKPSLNAPVRKPDDEINVSAPDSTTTATPLKEDE